MCKGFVNQLEFDTIGSLAKWSSTTQKTWEGRGFFRGGGDHFPQENALL